MHRKLPFGVPLLALLAVTVASTFAEPARATVTEIKGGPGGKYFQMRCGAGRYLTGIRAQAGAWVDGIGLVCAPMDAKTKRTGQATTREGWAGGKGGAPQEVYCAPGEAITAIGLAHTRGGGLSRQYVNNIDIMCNRRTLDNVTGCISSGEGCHRPRPKVVGVPARVVDYQYDEIKCPSNEYVKGIHGRAGAYVDAIGLICEPPPAVPRQLKLSTKKPAPVIEYGGTATTKAQSGNWSAFASNGKGRWGRGVHQASSGAASSLALNGCGGAAQGCKVFWTTQDKCVAFAESKQGGYWYGGGGGSSQQEAQRNALRFCQGGKAPANSCKAAGSWCG